MSAVAALVAIGSADMVLGFGLLGIDAVRADGEAETRQALERALADPETALVLIDESRASLVRDALEASLQASGGTLVVEVPGATGAHVSESLDERLERALGFKLRE